MKIKSLLAIGSIGPARMASVASAEDAHKIIAQSDVKRGPAPTSTSRSRSGSLVRDPSKEGLFALRLNFRPGMRSRRIPIQ